MKHPFFSRSKNLEAIVFVNALILGSTGIAHAQSQNPRDENSQKPLTTQEKPAKKQNPTNDAGTTGKKQSKQESGKDADNYKGAQPPQGGRIGQGPDHPD